MLMENVLAAAAPYLEGRTIKDLVIGLALIACELDNGDVGVSYVLREGLPRGCSRFPLFRTMIGQPAMQAAELSLTGTDNVQRGVAAGVLAAASHQIDISDDTQDSNFGLNIRPNDHVAMIGHISSIIKSISKITPNLYIFDKGLSDNKEIPYLSPMEQQPEILSKSDIVLISGTSTINTSIDSLLGMCGKTREIVLMGPSTPMFPEGFKGTRVTRLAGSFWSNEHKNEIFRAVSLAGGIASIEKYMIKKMIKIN